MAVQQAIRTFPTVFPGVSSTRRTFREPTDARRMTTARPEDSARRRCATSTFDRSDERTTDAHSDTLTPLLGDRPCRPTLRLQTTRRAKMGLGRPETGLFGAASILRLRIRRQRASRSGGRSEPGITVETSPRRRRPDSLPRFSRRRRAVLARAAGVCDLTAKPCAHAPPSGRSKFVGKKRLPRCFSTHVPTGPATRHRLDSAAIAAMFGAREDRCRYRRDARVRLARGR